MSNAALTHVEIPQLRDATELNNDCMIEAGDVDYQSGEVQQNLSILP